MFKSQNGSTWTPEQTQDLSFRLNRAVFNNNVNGNVTLIDAPTATFTTLPPNPFKITNGQQKVKVHHPNHGMVAGMYVKYYSSTDTQFNNSFVILSVTNSDYYIIQSNAVQTATNFVGGGTALTEKVVKFDSIGIPQLPYGRDAGLQVTFKATSIDGVDTAETTLIPGELKSLSIDRFVQSSVNKTNLLQGANSFTLKGVLSSLSDAISPVIPLDMISVALMGNKINNPSITDVDFDVDGTQIVSGSISFNGTTNVITVPNTTDYTQIKRGALVRISDSASGVNNLKTGYISGIDTVANTITIVGDTLITQSAITTAVITQYTTFISETQNDGTADSKLITTPVTITQLNTGFRVMVSFNIPQNTNIELYYRTTLQNTATKLSETSWTKYPITYKYSATELDLIDYEYNITNITPFDQFQFKFVLLSTSTNTSPKIKNLRIISHA
jgi:hypothetical protein